MPAVAGARLTAKNHASGAPNKSPNISVGSSRWLTITDLLEAVYFLDGSSMVSGASAPA